MNALSNLQDNWVRPFYNTTKAMALNGVQKCHEASDSVDGWSGEES